MTPPLGRIGALVPAATPAGRRGVGLVFAVATYGYALALALRAPQLARLDAAEALAVWAGLGLFWLAAVAPALVASPPGRRGARAFGARFRANGAAVAGLVLLVAALGASLLAPLLATADPLAIEAPETSRYQPPAPGHPMGTDRLGRDVYSRALYGARVSLGVAVLSALLAVLLGVVYGSAAGLWGGRGDEAMMRVVDGLLSFPRLLLVLTLVALFDNSVTLLVFAIAATGWMGMARLVRGEIARLRARGFVEAAVASGAGRAGVIVRHVLPNAIGPVVVAATLNAGAVILLESYLSFLGLGVQPPAPSWGAMAYEGRAALLSAWWVSGFPAAAITLTVVALNLVGDGLRDAFDTRAPEAARPSHSTLPPARGGD